MEDWKQELEEILEDETDTGKNMIPKYARCYAKIILENFIEQEIEKARKNYFEELLSLYGYREFDDGEHTGFIIDESLEMDMDRIEEERKRLSKLN